MVHNAIRALVRRLPLALVLAGTFAAGRASVRPAPLEIRASTTPGWVEVWRHGELSGEYCSADGAPFWALWDVVTGGPTLPNRLRDLPGPPVPEPLCGPPLPDPEALTPIREYLGRLAAVQARDAALARRWRVALTQDPADLAALQAATKSALELVGFFGRECNALAGVCPQVAELHRCYGLYLEHRARACAATWDGERAGRPEDAAPVVAEAEQLRVRAEKEQERLRHSYPASTPAP